MKKQSNMKTFVTELVAYCHREKDFKSFAGQNVVAEDLDGAIHYCNEYAPYLIVIGELMETFEVDKDLYREMEEELEDMEITEGEQFLYDAFLNPHVYNLSGQPNPWHSTITENVYTVSIEDLEKQLQEAIKDEDYESAADLRDEIKALSNE